jgi:RNA polymerase sigma factor (sigma-70 family)
MDYKVLTEREKNDLAVKYTPLVNKLINQYYSKGHIGGLTGWDQISSMAWEGFAIAINTFDSERSTMSFTQFAAFSIRNNILTSLDNELRTVKLSAYAQKKAVEKGETLWNSVSIDRNVASRDDDQKPQDIKLGMVTQAKFDDGDLFSYMYSRLENQFTQRDCTIFYMAFGLNGYEEFKGKEIAKELKISEGLVSQKIKKMTKWIKQDAELCEMLQNLF